LFEKKGHFGGGISMPKKIVVFADGTGNAFTVQESNVWRLYEALDQTEPDQIAHYIQGVGTSGFKPFAVLDVATGIGVPSNVRKLYQFICWNWRRNERDEPDERDDPDEIYMFGFSRGSFTIRTLIGLMHHEGLIPAQIGKEAVSHAEMERNVMAAWRSYRSKTIPWWKTLPTVWLGRSVRNVVLGAIHLATRLLLGHRLYSEVAAQTSAQQRRGVPIKFVGLFDTVEAFGVPLEEFRRAIDWAIWPISFRNNALSTTVIRACHGLSLDDERTAFHPLRIDRKTAADRARITEVWFAGVHSDVGGGYPEDDLALVALNWMTKEIGDDLRFVEGAQKLLAEKASPYAPMHDSRSGLGVFYRYCPRTVGTNGGAPLIHHSVAEKIAFGTDRYAPMTLPDTAHVLMPDGSTHEIKGFDQTRLAPARAPLAPMSPPMALAVQAVESLNDPDRAIVSLTLDNIWRRRVAYFCLLFTALLIASLPWTVKPAVELFRQTMQAAATRSGWASSWNAFWSWAANADQGSSAFLASVLQYIGSVLPGYAKPWAEALIERPTACGIIVALAIILYLRNGSLRDRIADLARQAWLPAEKTSATEQKKQKAKGQIPNTLATRIRQSKFAALLECAVSRYALPIAAIALIYVAVGVSISRSTVTLRDGNGAICAEEGVDAKRADTVKLEKLQPGQTLTLPGFDTSRRCWASGVELREGQHYALWIEMADPPFFDQTIMTDIAGFKDASPIHLLAWPIRRWWSADWFQPIARIGGAGIDTWALVSVDGDTAIPAGMDSAGNRFPKNFYKDDSYQERLKVLSGGNAADDPSRLATNEKIPPAELAKAKEIREKQHQLRRTYASNFTAHSDGELILYVNDAIAAIPFGPTITRFYENNTGKATIKLTRQLTPPPP
jgi:type VI secretion system (T6SS) phospholipase Tle1-like effector